MNEVTVTPLVTLVCCGLIGTLVIDDGLLERSFAEAIATQGVVSGTSAFARRMAQVHQGRGRAPRDVLGTLFPDNDARALAADLAFERALSDAIGRAALRPVPGVLRVLDDVRAAGCRVCVTTSLSQRALNAVLDGSGLRGAVDLALSRADAPRGFPAPDLVLTAMLSSGTERVADVAVIHSTGAGVEAGRRAGASVVAGVLTGPHGAARLRAAGATHVLAGIADLPGLLSRDGPAPSAALPHPADPEQPAAHALSGEAAPSGQDPGDFSVPVPLPR